MTVRVTVTFDVPADEEDHAMWIVTEIIGETPGIDWDIDNVQVTE